MERASLRIVQGPAGPLIQLVRPGAFSRRGGESLPLADPARLRQLGIYQQRPTADGGFGTGFYMIRIGIPGGNLVSHQVETIADIAGRWGRGVVDVTVRQNIQLHWIEPENLNEIRDVLAEAGLATVEKAAPVRNIVNCPASGIDAHELFDTTRIVADVNRYFQDSTEFAGLPRQFKIAITGCSRRCSYPEVNDIGIYAIPVGGRVLFRVRAGGGLSTVPRFSKDLGVLISPEHVLPVCAAVAAVFRDRTIDRQGALLNPLVHYQLEEAEVPGFLAEVETYFGYRLARAEERELAGSNPVPEPRPAAEAAGDWADRSHLGINRQRQRGLNYIGISLDGGRTSADGLRKLASLARAYGSGRVRTTTGQNVLLLDIPDYNLDAINRELRASGFESNPSWSRRGLIACSGVQFCNLALTETKGRAGELMNYLEHNVKLDEPLRISVTGCPNACGQHQICDVGLEGCQITVGGVKKEAFHILLGGGVGARETFARRIGLRIDAERIGESLRTLFTRFKESRVAGETFQDFCLRHSDRQLAGFLTQ